MKTTHARCRKIAVWICQVCKHIDTADTALHNTLLQLSQSLPLYYAAAGSAPDTAGMQQQKRNVLACALELSALLQKHAGVPRGCSAGLDTGMRDLDELIAVLTKELMAVFVSEKTHCAPQQTKSGNRDTTATN